MTERHRCSDAQRNRLRFIHQDRGLGDPRGVSSDRRLRAGEWIPGSGDRFLRKHREFTMIDKMSSDDTVMDFDSIELFGCSRCPNLVSVGKIHRTRFFRCPECQRLCSIADMSAPPRAIAAIHHGAGSILTGAQPEQRSASQTMANLVDRHGPHRNIPARPRSARSSAAG
jgi:hypothetical protein